MTVAGLDQRCPPPLLQDAMSSSPVLPSSCFVQGSGLVFYTWNQSGLFSCTVYCTFPENERWNYYKRLYEFMNSNIAQHFYKQFFSLLHCVEESYLPSGWSKGSFSINLFPKLPEQHKVNVTKVTGIMNITPTLSTDISFDTLKSLLVYLKGKHFSISFMFLTLGIFCPWLVEICPQCDHATCK